MADASDGVAAGSSQQYTRSVLLVEQWTRQQCNDELMRQHAVIEQQVQALSQEETSVKNATALLHDEQLIFLHTVSTARSEDY